MVIGFSLSLGTQSAPTGNVVSPPGPPPPAQTQLTAVASDGWQATWPTPPASVTEGTLSVTRAGFNAAGASASVTETLHVTARVRQPGSASPTADQVALSDYIYAGDVTPNLSNVSTRDYPYAQFAWAVPDRQEIKGNSIPLRIAVAHRHARGGKPVAAVRFIVRDHLGAEADLLVTSCTPQTYATSGLTASVYEGTVDITALSATGAPSSSGGTDGKTFIIDAEFRPWVGTAHMISAITTGKEADQNTTLTFGNNRDDWRKTVYAYVSTTGNNGSGVISETAATAQAAPFATTAAAGLALRNWHAANTGRGAMDGSVIRLEEGTHVHGTWTRRTCDHYAMTMEGAPGTNHAAVIYTDGGSNTDNSFASKIALKNLTLRKSGATSVRMLDSGSTDADVSYIALENVVFDSGGNTPAGSIIYRYGVSYYEGCSQNARLSTANKVIGCTGEFLQAGTTACLASRIPSGQINPNTAARAEGLFVGWSFITANKADYLQVLSVGHGTDVLGMAFVGNVMEVYGSASGPAVLINGDGNTVSSKNINMIGNTVLGGRMNLSYTDAGGAVRRDHLSVLRFNIFYEKNHKSGDFFGYDTDTPNPVRIGNWNVRYGVSACANTVLRGESRPNTGTPYYPMSWLGDVAPLGSLAGSISAPLTVGFADDQSSNSGAGDGDYTPVTTTDLSRVPAGLAPWPVDLMGRVIAGDGSAFAGAMQQP